MAETDDERAAFERGRSAGQMDVLEQRDALKADAPSPVRASAPFGDSRLPARFWARVQPLPNGCWLWTAGKNGRGYGHFLINGRTLGAHRVAYRALVNDDAGPTLDHLCRNRACVNPAHLEPVTVVENVLRGVSFSALNARKQQCLNGHPLTGDNLYIRPNGRLRTGVLPNLPQGSTPFALTITRRRDGRFQHTAAIPSIASGLASRCFRVSLPVTPDTRAIMRASADSLEAALIARESGATFESHLRGVVLAEVERLRYHASPPVATDGWQPISTAPKDGTELLLYEKGRIVMGAWNRGGSMHMPHWMGGLFKPTHWQPLPAPPADAPQEKV